jgi:hypothetical protein
MAASPAAGSQKASAAPEKRAPATRPSLLGDERMLRLAKIAGPALFVVLVVAIALLRGADWTILALAAGAMLLAIATMWTSLRAVFGETRLSGEDAYALGAPSVEEEQKRAVLRAIKDLEFERGVGKISEEDYRELTAHYRGEAKRLLRIIDHRAAPRLREVEKLVETFLASQGLASQGLGSAAAPAAAKPAFEPLQDRADDDAPPESEDDPAPASDESSGGMPSQAGQDAPSQPEIEAELEAELEAEPEPGAKPRDDTTLRSVEVAEPEPKGPPAGPASHERVACPSCAVENDTDAVFCKKCGGRVRPE